MRHRSHGIHRHGLQGSSWPHPFGQSPSATRGRCRSRRRVVPEHIARLDTAVPTPGDPKHRPLVFFQKLRGSTMAKCASRGGWIFITAPRALSRIDNYQSLQDQRSRPRGSRTAHLRVVVLTTALPRGTSAARPCLQRRRQTARSPRTFPACADDYWNYVSALPPGPAGARAVHNRATRRTPHEHPAYDATSRRYEARR